MYDLLQAAPHPYGQVRLSPQGQTALRWWCALKRAVTVPPHDGLALWQKPREITVHTDAATDYLTQAAWGGVLNWGRPDQETVRGVFTAAELANDHTNTSELRALTRTTTAESAIFDAVAPMRTSRSFRSTPPQAACVR